MKSATTWLSECLRAHPEIFMSDIKEIHYFSNHYEKGIEWYLKNFEKASTEKAIGEFCITYMDRPEIAERILKDLGRIKVLINLRNPVERFHSHVKHQLRISDLSSDIANSKLSLENYNMLTEKYPKLLSKGLYYEDVKNYSSLFGKENVLVTFKDDIDSNPKAVISQVYEFLGVNPSFEPSMLEKAVSPGTIPKYKALESFRVATYSLVRNTFPKAITWVRKYRLAEAYRKLNSSNQELTFSDEVVNELKQFYKEDISSLESFLDVNLNHWK
ncbi:MAG: sulfotransferase domain-containing protein [Oceanospirillaceae bacterium]|nr:sulfotransferase domain-containing protein [Oceanospirillaceae bacterium]